LSCRKRNSLACAASGVESILSREEEKRWGKETSHQGRATSNILERRSIYFRLSIGFVIVAPSRTRAAWGLSTRASERTIKATGQAIPSAPCKSLVQSRRRPERSNRSDEIATFHSA
jgi:hypothetical protein